MGACILPYPANRWQERLAGEKKKNKEKQNSCLWLITLRGSVFHRSRALTATLPSLYGAKVCLSINLSPLRHQPSQCASWSMWKPLQMGRRFHAGRLFSRPNTVSVFNWSTDGLSVDCPRPWSLLVVTFRLLNAHHTMGYPELKDSGCVWAAERRGYFTTLP